MRFKLLREFLSTMTRIHVIGGHILKDRPAISDPTKRHDKQLTLFDINKKLTKKCYRADLGSALDPLTQ